MSETDPAGWEKQALGNEQDWRDRTGWREPPTLGEAWLGVAAAAVSAVVMVLALAAVVRCAGHVWQGLGW